MPWIVGRTLTKNGNTVAVSLPRSFLHQLGWICGRSVVVELSDDLQAVVIRLPRQSDFGVPVSPKVQLVDAEPTR
jgi:antitoxin component of MazEF toxin-antitoxin module